MNNRPWPVRLGKGVSGRQITRQLLNIQKGNVLRFGGNKAIANVIRRDAAHHWKIVILAHGAHNLLVNLVDRLG